ncbi:MAG: hypothetical protein ACXAEX_01795 [Promethearchaeota archaeon]|jgi:acetyltransferase-like isoleucine patch superfamily enzyme
MANTESLTDEPVSENDTLREEINIQYFWYVIVFFTIFLASFLVPAIIFVIYLFKFFLRYFLTTSSFIALFTDLKPLLSLFSMPIVIIGCYLIRLFFISIITRGFWKLSEKKSPSKNGIIPRNFASRTLNYYHIRSFLIKYGKNVFMKGVFPWVSNWFFNFVGSNTIGKGTTFEESVGNDKFAVVGDNCYFGPNTTLASHMVEGTFGNIAYFQVKAGDNVTTSGTNQVGAGSEMHNNTFLLPLASTPKHSVLKGNNYYWGIPLRKIFRKKTMLYLNLTPKDLEKNENIEGYKDGALLKRLKAKDISEDKMDTPLEKNQKIEDLEIEKIDLKDLTEKDLKLDFTTSSAISRVNIKFLIVYIPIFWLSGMLVSMIFYTFVYYVIQVAQSWFLMALFMGAMIMIMWFVFILGCFVFSKLFLILINLIHKPKEGIFNAEIGDTDFEFWSLRTELKKIVLWFVRNWPFPWADIIAFRWFGIKMNLSSALYDAWCDAEFITFGRGVLIGQGSTIMSSMVVGKYLIIKNVICDDYCLVGGHTTIAPGTIIGKDVMVSAISNTLYNQVLEPGWIYLGIPVIKFKPNKYAETRNGTVMKRDVDEEEKFEIEHEVNIDEDKRDLA